MSSLKNTQQKKYLFSHYFILDKHFPPLLMSNLLKKIYEYSNLLFHPITHILLGFDTRNT